MPFRVRAHSVIFFFPRFYLRLSFTRPPHQATRRRTRVNPHPRLPHEDRQPAQDAHPRQAALCEVHPCQRDRDARPVWPPRRFSAAPRPAGLGDCQPHVWRWDEEESRQFPFFLFFLINLLHWGRNHSVTKANWVCSWWIFVRLRFYHSLFEVNS